MSYDDDYPEPPPNPPACPNCNEALADNPATLAVVATGLTPVHLLGFDHAHMGAYCIGPDGCGWRGTWEEAEEYLLDVGCAKAEAMADAGPDWRSEFRPGLIPVPGTVPDPDDPPTWEVTITLSVDGCTPSEALDEWLACNGPDRLPITSAVIA